MIDTYFEDLEVGDLITTGDYTVPEDEMIAFAEKWDPIPIHIDRDYSDNMVHGGLIATGIYILAVRQALIMSVCKTHATIGSTGYTDLNFRIPVRADDVLTATMKVTGKRESRTKSDRGVIYFDSDLAHVNGGPQVLTVKDRVMYRRRSSI